MTRDSAGSTDAGGRLQRGEDDALALPQQRTAPRPVAHSYSGVAFAMWGVSLALAVLLHEWAAVERPWSTHLLAGLAALAVLLRPSAVWRTVLLLVAALLEFVSELPQPYNDQLLIALSGVVVVVWWSVLVLRSPSVARDPAAVFDRVAPFLRCAFLVAAFTAATARLNTGFLDTLGSCAPKLIDEIPFVTLPSQTYGAVAVLMLVVAWAIPTLLLFRRTRPAGVTLGLGYCIFLIVGGDPALGSAMWTFLVLFLPTSTVARVAVMLRGRVLRYGWRRLGAIRRSPLLWVLLSMGFALGLTVMSIAPHAVSSFLHQRPPALLGLIWLLLWCWALWTHLPQWRRANAGWRSGLRVRSVVLVVGLALLVLNSISPYVGLKTHYSFADWSSLRTEPGRWNHLVIPEAVRVFHLQDGRVHFVSTPDADSGIGELLEHVDDDEFPLAEARRLAAKHPQDGLFYQLDGDRMAAHPIAQDPHLGGPVSEALMLFGGFRHVELDGTCSM
ncbi:MAG: hypothetical protein AB7J32_07580 [Pseudonocardia sp.]